MKQNYLLTLIMCLLLSSSLWAQDARKLVADFDKKGSVKAANRFFDYLDQEQFTDERIQFATNTPTDSLRKEVWYWAGEWFNDTQEYGLARQYALRALPLYRHDNAAKGDCLNLLAIIGVRLADFPAAAQYATRCVRIYKKLRDPDQTSSALNTLAGINLAANHPRQAEKHILQALRYASRANNRPRQAVINGMASEIYYKLGNYQRSLQYAQKAYVIDSLLGNEGKMAVRLTMQGAALGGMKRDDEAVAVYQKAIPTLRSVGNIHSLGIALNQMGFILLRQKQEQAAVEAFREASSIFSKMGDLYNGCTARKGLYEAYWNLNPDSARMSWSGSTLSATRSTPHRPPRRWLATRQSLATINCARRSRRVRTPTYVTCSSLQPSCCCSSAFSFGCSTVARGPIGHSCANSSGSCTVSKVFLPLRQPRPL